MEFVILTEKLKFCFLKNYSLELKIITACVWVEKLLFIMLRKAVCAFAARSFYSFQFFGSF